MLIPVAPQDAEMNAACSTAQTLTPPVFLDAVRRRLGITNFSHDFAAESQNSAVPSSYFSSANNAFSYPRWERWCQPPAWGWLCPPFDRIDLWAARAQETGQRGGSLAMLVPSSTGAPWFLHHVHQQARVLWLDGWIGAVLPPERAWLFPHDCMLCLYGPTIVPGYEAWSWQPKD